MKREFLGWKRPPLHSAADWLLQKYVRASDWDLSNLIVVLPTSRACRRLLELLVIKAEERKLTLSPPRIETLGNLPEHLYQPKLAFASDVAQIQALIAALKGTPREVLSKVVPYPPGPKDHAAWRSLAKLIQSTRRELASDRVTFKDVAEAARRLDQEEESDRWLAMDSIFQRYFGTLDALELWDRQTARLVALDKHEYKTDKHLVVIGAVDLNRTQRHILDQVNDQVTILTAAPEEFRQAFDEHGALEPEFWCESNIALDESVIRIVNKPIDQAFAAARRIAELANTHHPSDIAVGVSDPELAPILEASLAQAGVETHLASGISIARSSPFLLLGAISQWLADETARNLAALVRHPQVYAWLSRDSERFRAAVDSTAREDHAPLEDLLTMLDRCIVKRLVDAIPHAVENRRQLGLVAEFVASVKALLADLDGAPRPLREWAAPLSKLLTKLADAEAPATESQIAVWKKFADGCGDAWAQWQSLSGSLTPKVSASEAIDLLCEALESSAANLSFGASALHLLGWLDLPLDDAPAAVVVGFNEGVIPSALHGDVFLPNALRVELKLTDNRRRLARDAYALRLMVETKQSLTLIAGRLDSTGDPLLPSRLLFFDEPEKTAERVRALYAKAEETPRLRPAIASRLVLPKASAFCVPEPRRDRILRGYPKSMRVTKFRDFLACGYRFYLKELEKLETLTDEAEELAANRFGEILHAVLSQFGANPNFANEEDARKIESHLFGLLDSVIETDLSDKRHPALAVQLEQIRLRLGAFATWQADWRRKGWEIIHTEVEIG
jgi:ATP-dependent helicase/nuclease subunit B